MPRIEKEIQVLNAQGLHARPAALFVQIASKYDASISVIKDDKVINGKSIMGILMLGAEQYSTVKLVAEGDEAEPLMQELEKFLTHNGNEQ